MRTAGVEVLWMGLKGPDHRIQLWAMRAVIRQMQRRGVGMPGWRPPCLLGGPMPPEEWGEGAESSSEEEDEGPPPPPTRPPPEHLGDESANVASGTRVYAGSFSSMSALTEGALTDQVLHLHGEVQGRLEGAARSRAALDYQIAEERTEDFGRAVYPGSRGTGWTQ